MTELTTEDKVLLDLCHLWIVEEYKNYIRTKFTLEDDLDRDFDWWEQQFNNYLHRAQVLGVDNAPGAMQAIAKFAATAMGMFMTYLHREGVVPAPGVSSGNGLDEVWRIHL